MLYGEFGFEIEKVLNTFSNGEESIDILLLKNGDVITEDNFYIGDINDNEIEDKIDDFGEGWRETHWNKSDWADYYGVDENEVEDAMDDDLGWFED